LVLDQWDEVERHIAAYVQDERTTAFNLGSTLRQFTEVWDLDAKEAPVHGRIIVSALRARTLSVAAERPQRPDEPGGVVELDAAQLQRAVHEPVPTGPQLQAILGENGPRTYQWWRAGLERARGVASFRLEFVGRFGTGFLVRGGDLVPAFGDEPMVLTNWHVVNSQGAAGAAAPDSAEVLFEAEDEEKSYRIQEVVWSSPADLHDATLLRLAEPPRSIPTMPFAPSLPDLTTGKPRVYVIGHPGGRELSFSFQDNELLDHEGPPRGTPPTPSVCRLHYRAPTEPGSSGSPVFNGSGWKVLALHHAGGRDIPRLNGLSGRWDANQGVSIDCISAAIRKAKALS
jgi:S1-C subfamily serine protease